MFSTITEMVSSPRAPRISYSYLKSTIMCQDLNINLVNPKECPINVYESKFDKLWSVHKDPFLSSLAMHNVYCNLQVKNV